MRPRGGAAGSIVRSAAAIKRQRVVAGRNRVCQSSLPIGITETLHADRFERAHRRVVV
jgi:hypothetical protein